MLCLEWARFKRAAWFWSCFSAHLVTTIPLLWGGTCEGPLWGLLPQQNLSSDYSTEQLNFIRESDELLNRTESLCEWAAHHTASLSLLSLARVTLSCWIQLLYKVFWFTNYITNLFIFCCAAFAMSIYITDMWLDRSRLNWTNYHKTPKYPNNQIITMIYVEIIPRKG